MLMQHILEQNLFSEKFKFLLPTRRNLVRQMFVGAHMNSFEQYNIFWKSESV